MKKSIQRSVRRSAKKSVRKPMKSMRKRPVQSAKKSVKRSGKRSVKKSLKRSYAKSARRSPRKSARKGMILRVGYTRKSYVRKDGTRVSGSRVKASYIKDVGKPGKGKKLIPPLKEGSLMKHGYAASLDKEERRKSLKKAIKEYGPLSVFRKVNALAILNKSNPSKSKLYISDRSWIGKNYL